MGFSRNSVWGRLIASFDGPEKPHNPNVPRVPEDFVPPSASMNPSIRPPKGGSGQAYGGYESGSATPKDLPKVRPGPAPGALPLAGSTARVASRYVPPAGVVTHRRPGYRYTDTAQYECDACGVSVLNTALHSAFHLRVEK